MVLLMVDNFQWLIPTPVFVLASLLWKSPQLVVLRLPFWNLTCSSLHACLHKISLHHFLKKQSFGLHQSLLNLNSSHSLPLREALNGIQTSYSLSSWSSSTRCHSPALSQSARTLVCCTWSSPLIPMSYGFPKGQGVALSSQGCLDRQHLSLSPVSQANNVLFTKC